MIQVHTSVNGEIRWKLKQQQIAGIFFTSSSLMLLLLWVFLFFLSLVVFYTAIRLSVAGIVNEDREKWQQYNEICSKLSLISKRYMSIVHTRTHKHTHKRFILRNNIKLYAEWCFTVFAWYCIVFFFFACIQKLPAFNVFVLVSYFFFVFFSSACWCA